MKSTTGKSTIKNQTRKFISKFTLPLFVLSISLISSPNKANEESSAVRKSRAQVQNVSRDISKCEEWYALVTNSSDSTPWYDLLHSNTGYLEALAGETGDPLPALDKIAQGYFNDELKTSYSTSDHLKENHLSIENFQKIMDTLPVCEAYVAATDENNYSTESGREMGIGDSSDGNGNDTVNTQIVQCVSQANKQAQQQCLQQAIQNGNMKCQHEGQETHDYLQCKTLATFIMSFAVGKNAMQLQQTFRAGNSAIDAQQDLLQKQNTKDGIKMADTLRVQKDSLKQQGEMAYEMAAYNGTKAATLLTMIELFPTREAMYDQCVTTIDHNSPQTTHKKVIENQGWYKYGINKDNTYQVPNIYNGEADAQALCNQVLLRNDKHHNDKFFMNQKILDKVKQMAIQSGLEAIANGAQGALLNKQADIVDDAIGDIKEFEKPNFEQAGFQPSLASECTVNPNAEGCITLGGSTTSGFGSQSFGSTGAGSANLGNATLSGSDTSGTNSAATTKRNLLPSSVGAVQIGQGNKGGFSDAKVAAGSIKPGQGGAAGGGAGGGGGAGSAALPAGGGSNQGGGQAPSSRSGKTAIKVGMNGSGMGRVTGGRGAIGGRKSKSSSANPFAKLLGKNKKRGNTLSFRGPASQIGKSKGSLFQRISSRYKAVSNADQLLKYKATNSQ